MMSDRAKARLLAAGLSLLLSAQVVLILLGALVFFNRVYLGGANAGIGSILGNPPIVIVPPIVGSGVASAPRAGEGGGNGGQGPGPGGPGPVAPPVSQPLIGITADTNLPILGPRSIPIRVGESSGNNFEVTVPLPRARVTATISRRPICDLTKCTTQLSGKVRTTRSGDILIRLRQVPTKLKGNGHVPPGHSLEHELDRIIRSLLH